MNEHKRKFLELSLVFAVVFAIVWALISYIYSQYSKYYVVLDSSIHIKSYIFAFFLSIIILTSILFFIFRKFLEKMKIIAHINDRSSHAHVVVNSMGIIFVLILVPILYAVDVKIPAHTKFLSIISSASIVIAIVSFLDDLKEIKSFYRLLTQVVVVGVSMYLWRPAHGYLGLDFPMYMDTIITFLGWVLFINIYNFMDGIDGVTGIGTITISLGIILIMTTITFSSGQTPTMSHLRMVFIMLILIATSLSFLIFNWHKSWGFMGDVGSATLGYMLAGFLLYTSSHGHYVDAVIIASYQMGDISFSIIRLLNRKQKPWVAHRDFHFHRALRAGYSQQQVIFIISLCEIILLAIATTHIMYRYSPYIAFALGFTTTVIFLLFFHITFVIKRKQDPSI